MGLIEEILVNMSNEELEMRLQHYTFRQITRLLLVVVGVSVATLHQLSLAFGFVGVSMALLFALVFIGNYFLNAEREFRQRMEERMRRL